MDETDAFAVKWWGQSQRTFFANKFLGVPALQHPFDAWVTQEIISETRPQVVVETGTFTGGSALLWASLLELLVDDGQVVTIDAEDRTGRARELPLWNRRVEFVQGSSADQEVANRVAGMVGDLRVMVILDSLHTLEHVSAELDLFAPLVSPGCYLIVQDGFVNGHPCEPDWGPGPSEATAKFLAGDGRFEPDRERERMLFTLNPGGFLRRST